MTLIAFCNRYLTFQLTASQGGWHRNELPQLFWTHFNSQPHKEADISFFFSTFIIVISTHSLTRRLTGLKGDNGDGGKVFQLTASQGGWHTCLFCVRPWWTFQLTASQGGWRSSGSHGCLHLYFNSQPHKEADGLTNFYAFTPRFQLTASQGGWQQFQTKTYLSKTDFSTYYTY